MSEERNVYDYITKEEFEKIKEFSKGFQTPFLVLNLKRVEENFNQLKSLLPFAKIYYAIKANPNDELLKMLSSKGSNFDIATIYELDQLLKLGVSPDKISYGNTIKKEKDIEYAFNKGIRLFASDSISDLNKIARKAPESKVFFRIMCEGSGADWPLSRKFGAHPDMIYYLVLEAKRLGLIPYGISFHVGSQQRDIGQWDNAIAQCKYLFDSAKSAGINLKMINMGGGFPSNYLMPTHSFQTYADEIIRFLKEDFPEELPEIIIEPGRSLVGDAGVIVSEIVMISRKSVMNQYEWVFLDIGKFGGLIETIDESIKYPIFTEKGFINGCGVKDVILAGPTCDSADVLYEKFNYKLPKEIKEGDRLFIMTTGAYTATYCSVYFNGFPPLKVYLLK
ncbi:MAG TPA: type III PLP-dependent enzyme [Candidatus Woesearchaeota archaeon]|nr:type III PLP-dependent enzyme [Candidatus Woesearchaeota archaeon]